MNSHGPSPFSGNHSTAHEHTDTQGGDWSSPLRVPLDLKFLLGHPTSPALMPIFSGLEFPESNVLSLLRLIPLLPSSDWETQRTIISLAKNNHHLSPLLLNAVRGLETSRVKSDLLGALGSKDDVPDLIATLDIDFYSASDALRDVLLREGRPEPECRQLEDALIKRIMNASVLRDGLVILSEVENLRRAGIPLSRSIEFAIAGDATTPLPVRTAAIAKIVLTLEDHRVGAALDLAGNVLSEEPRRYRNLPWAPLTDIRREHQNLQNCAGMLLTSVISVGDECHLPEAIKLFNSHQDHFSRKVREGYDQQCALRGISTTDRWWQRFLPI
jgi:hypothetical protein